MISSASNQVALWQLRSSPTSWWRRGPSCWGLTATWEDTLQARSSNSPQRSTTNQEKTLAMSWPVSYRWANMLSCISVQFHFEKVSSSPISLVCFFPLIQKVTYKMKRSLFDLRTIAEVEGAGVKAGKHAEWKEQIIVPPLPQSALAGCSLIDIEYFIQVGTSNSSSPKTFWKKYIFFNG